MKWLIPILVFVVGCSVDYKAEVRSDTQWSGSFGGRTVDGSGDDMVDLRDETPVCIVVQKQTREGFLGARVIADGGFPILGPSDGDWVETTAEFGVVTTCDE